MKILTPEEHDERLRLYKQGLTDHEIAAILYLEPSTIYGWRKKRGYKANGHGGNRPISHDEHQRRLVIWKKNETATLEELGKKMGLSRAGVRNWMKKYGVGKYGNGQNSSQNATG